MYVKVIVIPDARKERIREMGEHAFEISVREPRIRNLANRRVTELLAALYRVGAKRVRLVAGHRSHRKVFDVELSA